jgi:hypothetical protein
MQIPEMNEDLPIESPEFLNINEEVLLNNSSLDSIQANKIRLNLSVVNHVTAADVEIKDSGANSIAAESVSINHSAVGFLQANTALLTDSRVFLVQSQETTINGNAGIITSQVASIDHGRNGIIISRDVHGGQINSVILLAGKISGPVETLIDRRSVIIFGLAAGAAMGAVFSLIRLFKRR